MEFKDKIVIVTGGAHGIGLCIVDEFRKAGATVCVIDKLPGNHFVGDISSKETLEAFASEIISKHGRVDVIVNNALPLMKGIDDCSFEEFQYALSVGVTAPFYMVKLLKNNLGKNASIVNISSSRDRMSQPQTESYTAAKGGIVIGKQKCNDFGKMICSKIGNNGTMFSATRVQYYWQQSCSTSKGSIFLIDSSFFK